MSAPPYLLLGLFLASGIMQPLLISTLGNVGAYDRSTLLFLLPNYVGMSLAGLLRVDTFSTGKFRVRALVILCSIDVASQFLCQYGLTVAGSSLYSIVYSSSTIWIAILSRVLIRRHLTSAQWVGCAVVVGGLSITGSDLGASLAMRGQELTVGASMILIGAISHALTWVLVEVMLKESDPILPEAVSACMGFAGVGVFGLWQLVYTAPRAADLIGAPIAAHGSQMLTIAASYATLTAASLVHAVTFYHLVGRIGCVTAGVMKGCQATCVFVGSHLLFCGEQPTQCFSVAKAWSLVLVVLGTTTYALGGQSRDAPEEPEKSDNPTAADYVYVEYGETQAVRR